MTDEELESIPLLDCPSCDSHNTDVRRASNGWYYVGCMDCFNKRMCEEAYIGECVEQFNTYARKCGKK